LLLFKYKIASLASTPEQARDLIYVPGPILPVIEDDKTISWRPSPPESDNTINARQIKARLESLNVGHDWSVIEALTKCRNALEHLHPTDSTSGLQASIAALFPMLSRFIPLELNEHPAALLGDAWTVMLDTHELIEEAKISIKAAWEAIEYPVAALEFLGTCTCPACASPLLQPSGDDVKNGVPIDTTDFQYECFACHQRGSLIELLQDDFSSVHEDPFDEHDRSIGDCQYCYVRMYQRIEGMCYWCGRQTMWPKCAQCSQPISDHAAHEGGTLCDRCAEDDWHYQRG
jgi:hypothetical protein